MARISNCENATAVSQYATVRHRCSIAIHTTTRTVSAPSVGTLPSVANTASTASPHEDRNACKNRYTDTSTWTSGSPCDTSCNVEKNTLADTSNNTEITAISAAA